ncbi:MAG: T9SS type A sorting domain-containing protein [Chitinophagales bacterium]
MKKKIYSLVLAALCSCIFFSENLRAELIDYELVESYSIEELETVLDDFAGGFPIPPGLFNFNYNVDVYKVRYLTWNATLTERVQASGALAVPQNSTCPLPMVVYQHGTSFNPNGVPSQLSTEVFIGNVMGADGYVVLMPDYLGLGESVGMHPYVHSKTEATAAIDMMVAAEELQEILTYEFNDQVFICGYSQGGHGAMALFYELETYYADEYHVAAAAPMSGPYDISVTQESVMWEDYSSPGYLPYVILGYQEAYPELFDGIGDVFNEEYDLFNNCCISSGEFHSILSSFNLPSRPIDMLLPDVVAEYETDPNHPLRVALADNDLYDWTPQAPVLLLGCGGDEQVKFENSIVCYDKFVENGVEDVEVVNFGNFLHNDCVPFCLIAGKQHFDKHRDMSNGIMVTYDVANPSNETATDGSIDLNISGGEGAYTIMWDNGMEDESLSNLPVGDYMVTIMDERGCYTIETITLDGSVGIYDNTQTLISVYPNPATDFVHIDLPTNINGTYNVQIHNIAGEMMRSFGNMTAKSLDIDVQNLNTGIYLVSLQAEGAVYQSKLMVY